MLNGILRAREELSMTFQLIKVILGAFLVLSRVVSGRSEKSKNLKIECQFGKLCLRGYIKSKQSYSMSIY